MPKAVSLAERLLNEHKNAVEALEIIPSSNGVFEVFKDGNVLFSKKELGRFPEPEEVENLVR